MHMHTLSLFFMFNACIQIQRERNKKIIANKIQIKSCVFSEKWQLKRQYLIDQGRKEGRRRIEWEEEGENILKFFPQEGKCEKT